ncbi:RNA polymerase sigma factor [Jiangella alkaliphila]|uniref:RNA polymerase sigma-70 factor, ECF subfamily n=1 Tax=Jiangella alkaliphila TaxID=419479 RepID=A0A1H2L8L4_9ACTN|nr:sigma-70 region 4 domain-containing protein [Jiangella alkaliphila]SDU76928.1 RNA polymerase sigma-70 factor, ECF subfamily [Jiangella alkaliphila]
MSITRASQQEFATATRVDESAAERICDRHGAALFSLAYSVLLDQGDAERVVVSVIAEVCVEHDVARDEVSMRQRLAYLTFVQCLSSGMTVASLTADGSEDPAPSGRKSAPAMMAGLGMLAGQQRAAIALVCFGGFSYRDVALLLDLPAAEVAGLLTLGLREMAGAGSSSSSRRHGLVGNGADGRGLD